MPSPLREFLVALKFNVDANSLRKFQEGVQHNTHAVRDFGLAITGMVTAVEESLRRVGRQFDNLYYLSQRTATSAGNISALRFAFKQIGLGVGEADSALESFQESLRNAPGLRAYANQLVPGFKDAKDFIIGAATEMERRIRIFGDESPTTLAWRRQLEVFGLTASQIRQIAVNLDAARAAQAFYARAAAAFGLDQTRAAEAAVRLERSWNEFWQLVTIGWQSFIVTTFPTIDRLLKEFGEWIITKGVPIIRQWIDEFDKFISKPENINEIRRRFVQIGDAAVVIGGAVVSITKGVSTLNKELGLTGTIIAGILALIAIRGISGALAAGIGGLFRLGATGARAGAGAGARGAPGLGLAGIGAAIAGLFAPDRLVEQLPHGEELKRGRADIVNDLRRWLNRMITGAPEGHENLPPDTVTTPPSGIKARRSSFTVGGGLGDTDLLTQRMQGFAHWWGGDSAFRPIVDLAGGVYDHFATVLRDVFGLNPAQPTVSPGGGGETRTGVAGAGRMPGHVPSEVTGIPSVKGSLVNQVVARARALGASEAVIQGITAAALGEGGLMETWKPGDKGTSFGPWQLHHGGRLNEFLKEGGKPGNIDDQVKFVLDTMNRLHPGFSKLTDPAAVVRLMHDKFLDYGAKESNLAPAARILSKVRESMVHASEALRAGARGGLPPGQRFNSAGQPISEHPEGETAGERANVRRSMDWIHQHMGKGGWGLGNAPGITPPSLGTERSTHNYDIDADHNVNITVNGAQDPHGTGRAVLDSMDRHSALHIRNLKTAIA